MYKYKSGSSALPIHAHYMELNLRYAIGSCFQNVFAWIVNNNVHSMSRTEVLIFVPVPTCNVSLHLRY